MNTDEIVRALRCFSNCSNTRCHDCEAYETYCEDHSWKDDYYEIAADLIESLHAQLATAQERARAAEADLKEAAAATCGFCRYASYHPLVGSMPGKNCPGSGSDCNGECVNYEWRGPVEKGVEG